MPERKAPRRPATNLLGYHAKERPQFWVPWSQKSSSSNRIRPTAGNLDLLTRESRQCLINFANYQAPKPTSWLPVPKSRRAAVLVALFVGRKGDLYVLLNRRASTMRSFAGDTSLPGGKMDPEDKTIEDTARREAFEEIGLPIDRNKAPLLCIFEPFWVEKQLVVTPVVVLILDTSLRPILNHSEVASLFSHPLASFLSSDPPFPKETELAEVPYHTYQDYDWHGPPAPVKKDKDSKRNSNSGRSRSGAGSRGVFGAGRRRRNRHTRNSEYLVPTSDSLSDNDSENVQRQQQAQTRKMRMHRFLTGREAGGIKPVYGLTAAIMIHVARIGYNREPNFEIDPPPFPPATGSRSATDSESSDWDDEEESSVPNTDMRIAWAMLNRPSPMYDALVQEGLDKKVDWRRARRLLGLDESGKGPVKSTSVGRREKARIVKAKL
ncbi:hypothetical protein D9758_007740 [Tetrapyrgos nigripes]|uniref:Nudix hydrolase domain-containing protein n=1 Tax=Tetrapyrgos nigripes TaxID=182062 RepID=A0A8H5LIH8_9AGAR|nr:hypothetical protein D9758_007740 [Tetrapyrgos nigripes]